MGFVSSISGAQTNARGAMRDMADRVEIVPAERVQLELTKLPLTDHSLTRA